MSPPRIPPLAREEWTDAARDVFAYWEGDRARTEGSRSNTMMTLAVHPKLAIAMLDLGKYFMLESTLSARQVKLIVLRVAHRYRSVYQWTHNSLGAKQVGITDEEIEAVKIGPDAAVWREEDRLLLRAVEGTCDGGRIDDAVWRELSDRCDRRLIMDLIHATGYFSMVAWGLIAAGVEIEPDFAAFSKNQAKDS
jgi:4-carboxymuconolactone decarboxylase